MSNVSQKLIDLSGLCHTSMKVILINKCLHHRWSLWLAPVAAMLVAALFTVLIFLLYYRMEGQTEANVAIRWNGRDVRLFDGEGTIKADALEIRQAGQQGVVLRTTHRQVIASVYGTMRWDITGLTSQHTLQVLWWTLDGQLQHAVQTVKATDSYIDLKKEPQWTGYVFAIGLRISGVLSAPVTVRHVELQPAMLTGREWLHQFWLESIHQSDWTQASTHFNGGATTRPLWPPVLAVAIWAMLSGLLYILWMGAANVQQKQSECFDWQWQLKPLIVFFLLGWWMLDLRWQSDLDFRLRLAIERFAGKNEQEKRLADLDGELYRFSLEIRRHLPEWARLFVISPDPGGFRAGRTRYHLLPHNCFVGFERPPHPDQVREGDYVLLLPPLNTYRFNRRHQLLEWDDGQLPVALIYSAPSGVLFRVWRG